MRTREDGPSGARLNERMSLFGPFYGACQALQRAVDHAERAHRVLGDALADIEGARAQLEGYAPSAAEEHLATRPGELLAFVGSCVEDFLIGQTAGEVAAASIEAYVRDRVHDFLRADFGREACCDDGPRTPTVACVLDGIRGQDETRAPTVAYTLTKNHARPTPVTRSGVEPESHAPPEPATPSSNERLSPLPSTLDAT